MLKVVCAIIVNENEILAAQLGQVKNRAFEWEFPGGKVQMGESAENAIIREILEELSIEIVIVKQLNGVIINNSEIKIELIPFLCKIEAGEIQLNEHKQIRWVSFGELEKLKLSTPDKMLIQQVENRSILEKYAGKNVHNTG